MIRPPGQLTAARSAALRRMMPTNGSTKARGPAWATPPVPATRLAESMVDAAIRAKRLW